MSEQHAQRQAGLRALRSTQRRREFPAWAALSSTARAVPERCAGMVWRRPGSCESHAYQSCEPNESYESDQSYQPEGSYEHDQSYESDQFYEPEGSYEHDQPDEPDQSYESY